MLRRIGLLFLLGLLLPGLCLAKDPQRRGRGEVAVQAGPNIFTDFKFAESGFAVVGRFGSGSTRNWDAEVELQGSSIDGGGFGVLGLQVVYHLRDREKARRLIPFVCAGGGVAFAGEAPLGLIQYGGGVKYFFTDRVGFRLDVRDYFPPRYADFHVIGITGGVVFRF